MNVNRAGNIIKTRLMGKINENTSWA